MATGASAHGDQGAAQTMLERQLCAEVGGQAQRRDEFGGADLKAGATAGLRRLLV